MEYNKHLNKNSNGYLALFSVVLRCCHNWDILKERGIKRIGSESPKNHLNSFLKMFYFYFVWWY